MTSLLSMGCFLGCLLAGPVMEKIGRRKTLMIVSAGELEGLETTKKSGDGVKRKDEGRVNVKGRS